MSKEIPILFQTDMVRAILDGRKTMTRRALSKNNSKCGTLLTGDGQSWDSFDFDDVVVDGKKSTNQYLKVAVPEDGTRHRIFCRWAAGDALWVRESAYPAFKSTPENSGHIYKADYGFKIDLVKEYTPAGGWKPSIHMPKVAARIWLEITEVKVERLQDITDDDCFSEGLQSLVNRGRAWLSKGSDGSARGTFIDLWNSINDNWDENPWVWVVSFKVLSTTGKP